MAKNQANSAKPAATKKMPLVKKASISLKGTQPMKAISAKGKTQNLKRKVTSSIQDAVSPKGATPMTVELGVSPESVHSDS